ncbi:MAG: aspartate--tRNA ligase [Candidatus Niyogibacteria bacterium]|nr:aspartate--tRNA ligase [Candidatus Niyogibacteria bacterium]
MKDRILTTETMGRVGKTVRLAGWVAVRRDHGKLIFIDLRDMSGIVQVVFSPDHAELMETASRLRPEWVIAVEGVVKERPRGMVNAKEPAGAVEIEAMALRVLNESETPPFELMTDGKEVGEEHRLEFRYLDLRRGRMRANLAMRHRFIKEVRDRLDAQGFTEVETPILSKSTPEGARDYIVPARLYPGQFYALPQSPQQYKQLLMVAGMERYFQIARCFRDEDTRGDRQPEFTQLDIEMSFVEREDVMGLVEDTYTSIISKLYPEKHFTASPWPRLDYAEAIKKYGSDKPDLRENKNDPDELAFAWVVDFPLFEDEKTGGHFAPSHHMFTKPLDEDLPKLESDPALVRGAQYDLVLNGFEIGGGSIRIHDPRLQEKIFDLIGFDEKRKAYFDHMLRAFRYGVPPHGGIALGLDRLLMILQGESTIREVIAFPKTGEGRDLMMGAPADVLPLQLEELHLRGTLKDRKRVKKT